MNHSIHTPVPKEEDPKSPTEQEVKDTHVCIYAGILTPCSIQIRI